jgi:hypothetical protein
VTCNKKKTKRKGRVAARVQCLYYYYSTVIWHAVGRYARQCLSVLLCCPVFCSLCYLSSDHITYSIHGHSRAFPKKDFRVLRAHTLTSSDPKWPGSRRYFAFAEPQRETDADEAEKNRVGHEARLLVKRLQEVLYSPTTVDPAKLSPKQKRNRRRWRVKMAKLFNVSVMIKVISLCTWLRKFHCLCSVWPSSITSDTFHTLGLV